MDELSSATEAAEERVNELKGRMTESPHLNSKDINQNKKEMEPCPRDLWGCDRRANIHLIAVLERRKGGTKKNLKKQWLKTSQIR